VLVQNSSRDLRRPTYSLSIAASDGQRSTSRMPFLVSRYSCMVPRLAFCATVSVRKSEEMCLSIKVIERVDSMTVYAEVMPSCSSYSAARRSAIVEMR
jgi:hypothetical protein